MNLRPLSVCALNMDQMKQNVCSSWTGDSTSKLSSTMVNQIDDKQCFCSASCMQQTMEQTLVAVCLWSHASSDEVTRSLPGTELQTFGSHSRRVVKITYTTGCVSEFTNQHWGAENALRSSFVFNKSIGLTWTTSMIMSWALKAPETCQRSKQTASWVLLIHAMIDNNSSQCMFQFQKLAQLGNICCKCCGSSCPKPNHQQRHTMTDKQTWAQEKCVSI